MPLQIFRHFVITCHRRGCHEEAGCGLDVREAALEAARLGWVATGTGRWYCGNHIPKVHSLLSGTAVCCICGCSDAAACDEGCHWVGTRLCSACLEKLEAWEKSLPPSAGAIWPGLKGGA
jgi:hypothetical protein